MDIKDLDKKQLILLTLLITFVVSIATGIVTVSLMSQMPKSVPQTINNVIQRTIEKVTTVEAPVKDTNTVDKSQDFGLITGSGDSLVNIYSINSTKSSSTSIDISNTPTSTGSTVITTDPNINSPVVSSEKELGQGIIISDVGLILVDSSILNESQVYKVVLNKIDFDATLLKKFGNGFTILKITEKKANTTPTKTTDTTKVTQ
ncbi:MAG: hypothetical protein WCI91_03070 [Candidatus Nomurabacteria bacterium]